MARDKELASRLLRAMVLECFSNMSHAVPANEIIWERLPEEDELYLVPLPIVQPMCSTHRLSDYQAST